MPTYLVVANQTLGGENLLQELRRRIEAGNASFRVVVPMTEPEHRSASWGIEGMHHMEPMPDLTDAIERARQQSERQLNELLQRLDEMGAQAQGHLGVADPFTAVQDAIEQHHVDEIILSTLPAGISRWLKMDLASRLDRRFDQPLTVVEAEPRT